MLKKGGYYGRKTLTDAKIGTLHPSWESAKRPIYYHGTRSDLENETLKIEVWDKDQMSSDDLMGFVDVPLRGVLASGRIEAAFGFNEKVREDDSVKERLVPAGKVSGYIEILDEPQHTQFGDVVKRLPKMTYLAVQVGRCQNLRGKNLDGTSDPFISAVWAATSQQTRVVRASRSPNYDETLYFPTNSVRLSADDIEAKGDLVVYVMHRTGGVPEDLGFVTVSLDKVTGAPVQRVEDGQGDIKSRVYDANLPLSQAGYSSKSGADLGHIQLKVYFTPDLPGDVIIEPRKFGQNELPKAFKDREDEWRSLIPYRLLASGRYQTSALDETNTRRFLPTYLAKCAPPRDVTDRMAIARMVHCICFQVDDHMKKTMAGGGLPEELWSSPNYFLDAKKGASEDHAILQANLFLGLGSDAYLAIGKLPGGLRQHVWVVTREGNGDVLMWETTKGSYYK